MAEANARIFREMQAADALRQQMREGIMAKFQQAVQRTQANHRMPDQVVGSFYDNGIRGALNDCFRRVFEQGWFNKDIFDGRFQMDTTMGQDKQEMSVEGMAKTYDSRAEFYGYDQKNGVDTQEKAQEPKAQQVEMDQEMER